MNTSDQGVLHIEAGEGTARRVFGEVVTRKVASERTGGAYTLLEAVSLPGGGVPPHIHHREDECLYILEGEFAFTSEGRTVRARTGSLVYVPKGTLHSHENVGENEGRMLVFQTPGGACERFYEEVGSDLTGHVVPNLAAGSPEAARLSTSAARYGIEIVLAGACLGERHGEGGDG